MAKVAYLDCPTGIAGDMCLGAIIDAGMPLDYLVEQLATLGISDEYRLRAESVHRNGQRATKVYVDVGQATALPMSERSPHPQPTDHPHGHGHSHLHDHDHNPTHGNEHHHAPAHSAAHSPHDEAHTNDDHHQGTRHLPDIETLIQSARLPERVKNWSLAIFRQLAKAEGAVHGIAPEQVHFHEVGATDAIADIVGTCIGLDWLDIDPLYCSPLPTGGGTVWAAHGRLPVPAPAVLHLLQMGQVPIYSNGIDRELVTPTGAAIATTLATAFGPPPAMTLKTIGLGAGGRDLAIPNILRLWIGESSADKVNNIHPIPQNHSISNNTDEVDNAHPTPYGLSYGTQTITILETQLDDLNPQVMGYLFDQLLGAGALDVFTQAVGMKKSRPGILLTVLCLPEKMESCEAIIYRETTTLGIRRRHQTRSLLHRELHTVSTPYGPIPVKFAFDRPNGHLLNIKPEYEDCARFAQEHQVSLSTINDAAIDAAHGYPFKPEPS